MPAASATLSFVLAILGKSFPSGARVVLPRANACKLAPLALALGLVAAGCGGSSRTSAPAKEVRGTGYSFRVPGDWRVRRRVRTIEARDPVGTALVSVTTFRLARPFDPSLWPAAVKEFDRVAKQVAAEEGSQLERSGTETVDGERARTYDLSRNGVAERLGFVLRGRREYELYCRGAGSTCGLLFSSFAIRGPGG